MYTPIQSRSQRKALPNSYGFLENARQEAYRIETQSVHVIASVLEEKVEDATVPRKCFQHYIQSEEIAENLTQHMVLSSTNTYIQNFHIGVHVVYN